jgi:hypothetical protein
MTYETATLAHPAKSPSPAQAQAPASEKPAQGDRLAWLFRETLRRHQVHPLMELLRRYRGQEGA